MTDILKKVENAMEAIKMLEIVRESIDRDLYTDKSVIIRDVNPESLDFVIDSAINSIRGLLE